MTVSVTEAAASHVSGQLQARGRGEGIRIGVKTSGCSGLAYVLEFVDAPDPEPTYPQCISNLQRKRKQLTVREASGRRRK